MKPRGTAGLHALLGHRTADLHHAQRGNERRKLSLCYEDAGKLAKQESGDDAHQDSHYGGRHSCDADLCQKTGLRGVNEDHDNGADCHQSRTDGKINAPCYDDKGHAKGDDADCRVIAQDVDPVAAPDREPFSERALIKTQGRCLKDDHQQKGTGG